MSDQSDRLALPFLAVAQAQKEMTHNEALALIDIAAQPVVQAVAPANVPTTPLPGQCWIVGPAPQGAWAGRAGALAGWTSGGWRFVTPFEGLSAWSVTDRGVARYTAGAWAVSARQGAIAAPLGGTVIDVEGRAATALILATLRAHGLIAP